MDTTSRYRDRGSRYAAAAPSPSKGSSAYYTDVEGLDYTRVATPGGEAVVVSCRDGNLRVAEAAGGRNPLCSDLFAVGRRGAVSADGARRPMHYDARAMARLGVARLRLRADGRVTRAGVAVSWELHADAGAPERPYYRAVDAAGRVLCLVVCDYADDGEPLVFVASDARGGAATLQEDAVRFSVTGGAVRRCYPLVVAPTASPGQAERLKG